MIDIWIHIRRFFCFHTRAYRNWIPRDGWTVTCNKCGKRRR